MVFEWSLLFVIKPCLTNAQFAKGKLFYDQLLVKCDHTVDLNRQSFSESQIVLPG